jgi:hypothetical protein
LTLRRADESFSGSADRRSGALVRALAVEINVSLSGLLRFFRGEGGVSLDTAAALAEWANLRLDDYVKAAR